VETKSISNSPKAIASIIFHTTSCSFGTTVR